MTKKNNFYVIGGQYESYCYGGAHTLIGAKRMANRNQEYWDNWQGWHTPAIYYAEDTEPCNNFYGVGRCPKDGALSVSAMEKMNKSLSK